MKNKRAPKTIIWKYSTVKIFIVAIVFMMVLCIVGAKYFYHSSNFIFSTLLNVFGGLFTGLIILSYQYLSNKYLKEADIIVKKLKSLCEIPIFYPNELDFSPEVNRLLSDEMEEGVNLDMILEDDEGVSYALYIYKEKIEKAEKQFGLIKEFLNNILRMPLDYSLYEKELMQTKHFFSGYSVEIEYAMPPYLLRKYISHEDEHLEYSSSNGDIIEIFNTEEEIDDYLDENPDILIENHYYIDGNRVPYDVQVVFKDNKRVIVRDVYKDWIQKMNSLAENTKKFNDDFIKYREKMLIIHNKNSNIIH